MLNIKKIKRCNQHVVIFSVFSLIIIGFSTSSFAVEDNVTIEGNLTPFNRSEELYVIKFAPATQTTEITFSIYDSIGVVSSYTSFIETEQTFTNFYIKFFPPLFEDNKKYTIEVNGQGLIGRETITILEEVTSYSIKPSAPIVSDEEQRLDEEQRIVEQQRLDEEQRIVEQQRLDEEQRIVEQQRLDEEKNRLESQKQKIQCGEGTFLENGLCIPVPNYFEISACEKAGGKYDSVKLSCIFPEPIINSGSDRNQNSEEPPYGIIAILVFVMMIIIPISVKKSRNNKVRDSEIKKENKRQKEFEKQERIWKAERERNLIEDQKMEDQRKKNLEEKKRIVDEAFEKQKQLLVKSETEKVNKKIIFNSEKPEELLDTNRDIHDLETLETNLIEHGTSFVEKINDEENIYKKQFLDNKQYDKNLKSENSILNEVQKKGSINQNPCPKCGIMPNVNNIESIFGMRVSAGNQIRQSYCRNCRSISVNVKNKTSDIDENEKVNYKISENEFDDELNKNLIQSIIFNLDEISIKMQDFEKYNDQISDLLNKHESIDSELVEFFKSYLNETKDNIMKLLSKRVFFSDTPYKYIKNSLNELNEIQENIQENITYLKNSNQEFQDYIDEKNLQLWNETNYNELDQEINELIILDEHELNSIETSDGDELNFIETLVDNFSNIIDNQNSNIGILENIKNNVVKILANREIKNKVIVKKSSKIIKSEDTENDISDDVVAYLAYKMVKEYKRTHKSNGEYQDQFIDKKLKLKLIKKYEALKHQNKTKLILKICKLYPKYSKMKILRHLTTPIRLPEGLQELERTGGLGTQFQTSLTIALCACDYYDWDGEVQNEQKIEQLAKRIWDYLKNDNDLMDSLKVKY